MSNRPLDSKICLSFDVECYYQIVRKDYLGLDTAPTSEVLENTNWIFDELRSRNIKSTFYFLGNVAEHFPELVATAVRDGHEIGVHGDKHEYINMLSPDQFRQELASAMAKIRSAGAEKIIGHRAPAFSIGSGNLWALDVLREAGLEYDSSIMPMAGRRYGIGNWSRHPTMTDHGICEIPLSVVDIFGKTVPCMGGGYVRYFPFTYTQYCAGRLHKEGRIPVCYFHPYEFESRKVQMQPGETEHLDSATRSRLNKMNTLQSYGRGKPMRNKLRRLMDGYQILTVGSLQTNIAAPN
jgi:polysaccharide deacetylase family protein (PEP-CTERM system associated)